MTSHRLFFFFFFFFNDTATTEIYTLSLHDALPICEDLRLGEPALDLDGEQRLLYLAIKRAVGREKQVARQLHRERQCSLHFPARFDVAIRSAYDTPDIDARVPAEVFIFDRDMPIAHDVRRVGV